MSSINKFTKVNENTICLIYGYVRIIDITNQIIPNSIIGLLINFFYAVSKIAFIEENNDVYKPPHIYITQLNSKVKYQCNVKYTR